MEKNWTQWAFVAALVLIPLMVFGVYVYFDNATLKIYGETTRDDEGNKVYHTIPSFSFVDQKGRVVTEADFPDVYVANFFFTACPSVCPKMTTQLERVQEAFADDSRVKFISHSVDPVRDSLPRLQQFAERFHIDAERWHLVTGDKNEIYKIARNGYEVTTLEGDAGGSDFIHSENLILIDSEERIRGYYDGTDEKSVSKLISDIERLLKEEQEL